MMPRWRLWLKFLLVLLCLVYLGYSLRALGPGEVWAVARQSHLGWLFLSLLPIFGRFLLWSWKWQWMVKREAPFSFALSHRLIMAAAFINLATPTAKLGGAIYRALFLKKRLAFRTSRANGWVFADQMAHLMGNLALIGAVAFAAPIILPSIQYRGLLYTVGSISLVIPFLFLISRNRLWEKGQGAAIPQGLSNFVTSKVARLRGNRNKDSLAQFLWPWLGSGRSWQYASVEMTLSASSFAMLGVANAWVLTSLGEDVHWLPVLMVVILAYFGGSVLGVMGGIGVTEVFLLKLYPLVGVSHTHAAAGAILHRALFYAFVLILGGWAFLQARRTKTIELIDVTE